MCSERINLGSIWEDWIHRIGTPSPFQESLFPDPVGWSMVVLRALFERTSFQRKKKRGPLPELLTCCVPGRGGGVGGGCWGGRASGWVFIPAVSLRTINKTDRTKGANRQCQDKVRGEDFLIKCRVRDGLVKDSQLGQQKPELFLQQPASSQRPVAKSTRTVSVNMSIVGVLCCKLWHFWRLFVENRCASLVYHPSTVKVKAQASGAGRAYDD